MSSLNDLDAEPRIRLLSRSGGSFVLSNLEGEEDESFDGDGFLEGSGGRVYRAGEEGDLGIPTRRLLAV